MTTLDQARVVLRQHFGHADFREPQGEIVQALLSGRDSLVVMPTGGGKSLCYQLPALMLDGVTLVVSPLIALMKDQVDALRAKGIAAGLINSTQDWATQRDTLDEMRRGHLKLVYVAPERFRANSFCQTLAGTRIAMLAIDEAHCISQWGHDFRPDYLRLGEALAILNRPLCVALTATATPDVRADIQHQLKLRDPATFVAGFARANLTFNITHCERKVDKAKRLRKLIERHRTGIIYAATRKSVEALSEELRADRIAHTVYHAGLSPSERAAAQEQFISGRSDLAVATSAFGMGIDRADLRLVCHYEMPGSIEAFYQEAGRAGRDGLPAHCELLFFFADKRVQEFFIEGANPEPSRIRELYDTIRQRANAEHEVHLSVDDLTEALGGKKNSMAVQSALGQLKSAGYLERFDLPGTSMKGTRLMQPRLTGRHLNLPDAALQEKRQRDLAKLNAVIQMAYSRDCRQAWILRYFGESHPAPCGKCDVCRAKSGLPEEAPVIAEGTGAASLESDARTASQQPASTPGLPSQTALRAAPTETYLSDEGLAWSPDQLNEVVRKALSGVARMSVRKSRYDWQPRHGRTRIVECLRGSQSASLLATGASELSTYGLFRPLSTATVNQLFEALAAAGLVAPTASRFPLLRLTEEGARVMLGEAPVAITWPPVPTSEGVKVPPPPPAAAGKSRRSFQKGGSRKRSKSRG